MALPESSSTTLKETKETLWQAADKLRHNLRLFGYET
jgi:hypothetical protein